MAVFALTLTLERCLHGAGGAWTPTAEVHHQVQLHGPASGLCQEHPQTGGCGLSTHSLWHSYSHQTVGVKATVEFGK